MVEVLGVRGLSICPIFLLFAVVFLFAVVAVATAVAAVAVATAVAAVTVVVGMVAGTLVGIPAVGSESVASDGTNIQLTIMNS